MSHPHSAVYPVNTEASDAPVGSMAYFDPHEGGHRTGFLAFYLRACERSHVKLKAYVPTKVWEEACALAKVELQHGEHAGHFEALSFSFSDKCEVLGRFLEAEKRSQNTLLYLSMMDDYVLPLLYLRLVKGRLGCPWSGVFFRDSFNYWRDEILRPRKFIKSQVRWALLSLALRCGATEILTLNEVWKRKLPARVSWLPDALSPTDMQVAGLVRWPIPSNSTDKDGRVCFLMFGAMAPRKGVLEVVNAMATLDNATLLKVRLRLLGRFDPTLRDAVKAGVAVLLQRGALVEILDQVVPEELLQHALCNCDYVLAPYTNHIGSSGVVGLAARYGRPVLAYDRYQVGEEVRQWELGVAVNCRDHHTLVAGLHRLIRREIGVTAGMRRYTESRTPEHANRVFDAFLRRQFPRTHVVMADYEN